MSCLNLHLSPQGQSPTMIKRQYVGGSDIVLVANLCKKERVGGRERIFCGNAVQATYTAKQLLIRLAPRRQGFIKAYHSKKWNTVTVGLTDTHFYAE